jgi:choline kinase
VKAIILSAGQGRRLMPYTESLPKCLLPVDGNRPALEVQLRALWSSGVTEARVMVGFQAEKVDAFLATNPVPGIHVETVFNPFFDSSDNLVTAWLARPEMSGDFLLMNGDTLFEPAVLRRLLSAPMAPITLVVNGKDEYDDDDMKVSMSADGRLRAVSKTLPSEIVNGESIGLMRFTGQGVAAFQSALDRAVRTQHGLKAYYLSIIDQLSHEIPVETALMTGLWWGEIDSPEDLASVRADLSEARKQRRDRVVALRGRRAAPAAREWTSEAKPRRAVRSPQLR